jgi:hypothetical protein
MAQSQMAEPPKGSSSSAGPTRKERGPHLGALLLGY